MKKVLIISYYWPPAGGSGVQRWLKFAKYLPNNNWEPIIYTPKNPYLEIKDKELLNHTSSEVEVWKTPIWEPYILKDQLLGKENKTQSSGVVSNKRSFKNRLLNWIRGNVFVPDPKVYWVKPSVKYLNDKIKERKIEYIITTGPPHSMHLIGLALKKEMPHLKWISDFRDPWSELDLLSEFYLSNSTREKHQKLEKEVLKTADVILTVSETWVKDLKRLGAKRVELITNGYDIDDFEIKPKKNDKFIIGHYGLLNHLRNPSNLWKVLNVLCDENEYFKSKLEIHFSGNIDEQVISEVESFTNLKDKVKKLGYLSHTNVLYQYNEASVLLLLLFNSRSGVGNYPAKIFEYLASKKPILAFGPENSDVERLLLRTNNSSYFSYEDMNIRDSILKYFNYSFTKSTGIKIEDYSRERLTKNLANILDTLN